MAEPQGIVFGKRATEQIAQTVREVARRVMNEKPHRARWQQHTGGIGIEHGIVIGDLGCGYYTIEKATWSGDRDTAGSGLGSGSGSPDCDVCFDVVGAGTDQCSINLTIPPLQVTGTGVYVTAYDSASSLIPLIVGTSCLIANLGDRLQSGSGSGSGTGEAVWQIVRGMQSHVVEYKEQWDCCDGPGESGIETLISRTPVILIGKECEPIQCGTCDVASGSGSGV